MAPKKTTLLLTLTLLTGITAAQSLDITSGSQNVWANNGEEVEFNYTRACNQEIDAHYTFDGQTQGIETDNTTFSFDSFSQPGSYNFTVGCEGNNTQSRVIEAGRLEISGLSLTYEEGGDAGYPEGTVQASFSASIDNEENFDFSLTEEDFALSPGKFSNGFQFSESGEVRFTFEATEDMKDENEIEVSALGNSASTGLNIDSVWQYSINSISADGEGVEDSINKQKKVKYRDLDSLEMSVGITKRGEPQTGLSDYFIFDGEDRFDVETDQQPSGTYLLTMDSTPVYSKEELNVETPMSVEMELDADTFSSADNDLLLADLVIEKDVEFSGNVLDVSNNRVNTDFSAFVEEKNSRYRFNTDDAGNFERFFEIGTVDMDMSFPEATVSLANMNVDKEDAGDISYQYYSNPSKQSNIDPGVDVRPVNLAAFVSNYPFQADSLDTYVEMQYDTSNVDPLEVVVYECSQWTFDAEECSSEWEKIENNDVNLESGSTWTADFPIDPLTSDRFATDEGVLQNAYLISVPKGVGSSLTLQSSLDVSSTSIRSGKELSVSGAVIDSSTGEGVEGADVSLELVSEDNTVSLDGQTDGDGGFEFSTNVEDAGDYTVSFEAEKSPYESFSKESDSSIEVYYQTGLTVSSEENVDLQFGESSSIEFTVENVGQSSVENLEFDTGVSGIDEEYYSWSLPSESSVDAGDSVTVTLNLDVPSDSDVTPGQKTISLSASGSSAGENLENSATVYATVPVQNEESESTNQESSDEESTNSDSDSSFNVPNTQDVSNMTGEFIQSQSDMNLALGLILVFGAVLAVTVRKRKNGDDRDGRRMNGRAAQGGAAAGAGRGKVQRPKVSPEVEEEETETEDSSSQSSEEVEESESENESTEEGSDSEFVCDTCGDEFDTESGLKLHKQALH